MKTRFAAAYSYAGLAAHLGRGALRGITDAIVGSRAGLPRSAADLETGTLSTVMGATVTSLHIRDADAGTSSRARVALEGQGVPETVFVKLPASTAATRLMGELGRLGATEARFYQQLSAGLDGVPHCYGTAFDTTTGRYLIVLEDLSVQSCVFPDTLHPLSIDQAALVLELLAKLHSALLACHAKHLFRRP